MLLNSPAVRCLSIVWAFLMFTCVPVHAQPDNTLQVLILNSYSESTTPYFKPRDVFMTELQRRHATPIAFRQFDLEKHREGGQSLDELKVQFLKLQYADGAPDLVVAFGPPAVSFWLDYRDSLFSEARFIAMGGDFALAQMNFRSGDVVVGARFSFTETIEAILGLLPETSHIVMVFGASAHERALSSAARQQLQSYAGRISFEYTNDLALDAVQRKLIGLPPNAVVFYGVFDSDSNGVLLRNYSGLAVVRAASAVPVFGPFDDQLGRGIVGGRLMPLEQIGREVGIAAEDLLRSKPKDVAWTIVDLSTPTYDWRELQAWGIDPHRLPPGSSVRFKPPGVWEQYASWIILAAVIFSSQSLLAGSLWLQRRRLRQSERVSSTLGRKLISAQEDERRLIARELHDDLSQRLAGLAIDASYAVSNQGSEQANEVLRGLHPSLVQVSKDVHDLSYRLHPSLLDDLGLVAALQAEFDRLHRRSDSAILNRVSEIPEHIPRHLALCIYRVAQEAVNNAIKHARARTIEVTLECDGHDLILSVRDDGIGFDTVNESAGAGLGLSSMQERAQLAGGTLSIRSPLGKGTTLSVIVPLQGTIG